MKRLPATNSKRLMARQRDDMAWQVLYRMHPYFDLFSVLFERTKLDATPGYPAIWDMILSHYRQLLALDASALRALEGLSNPSNAQRWRGMLSRGRSRSRKTESQQKKAVREILKSDLSAEQQRKKLQELRMPDGALRGLLYRERKRLGK